MRTFFASKRGLTALPLLIMAFLTVMSSFSASESELSSKDAYEKLMSELKVLEHSVTRGASMEKILEVFDKVEERMLRFVEEYPEADESLDVKYQLGMLNTNINKNDKAIKYLEDFIKGAAATKRKRLGYANYFIAKNYVTSEQFDLAKKYYNKFINEYSDIDVRLTNEAKTNLEDLEVLKKLTVGNPPIPFKVKDMKGKALSLKKLKGKVVLIDFWATWCGPCRKEMPNVIELYKKHSARGFEIVGVSLDSKRESVEKYIKENGIDWPQYFDGEGWKNSIAHQYRVRSIPATFLLDRKGNIRYKSLRGRELARALDKLLREH